jgi:hypothetical protein
VSIYGLMSNYLLFNLSPNLYIFFKRPRPNHSLIIIMIMCVCFDELKVSFFSVSSFFIYPKLVTHDSSKINENHLIHFCVLVCFKHFYPTSAVQLKSNRNDTYKTLKKDFLTDKVKTGNFFSFYCYY